MLTSRVQTTTARFGCEGCAVTVQRSRLQARSAHTPRAPAAPPLEAAGHKLPGPGGRASPPP